MPVVNTENVPFDSPRARELADLAGIERDLRWTATAFEILSRRATRHQFPMLVLEGLHDAGLIRYGRCFGGGRRHAFRIPRIWIDELPAELQGMHARAIAVRDKHVAHSANDWELNVPVAQIATTADGVASTVRSISVEHHRVLMLGIPELRLMQTLAEALIERASAAGKELTRELHRELRGIPPREIRRRAPARPRLAARHPGKDRPR
jgi:hypothetical protein